jgi:hypothetical protein
MGGDVEDVELPRDFECEFHDRLRRLECETVVQQLKSQRIKQRLSFAGAILAMIRQKVTYRDIPDHTALPPTGSSFDRFREIDWRAHGKYTCQMAENQSKLISDRLDEESEGLPGGNKKDVVADMILHGVREPSELAPAAIWDRKRSNEQTPINAVTVIRPVDVPPVLTIC